MILTWEGDLRIGGKVWFVGRGILLLKVGCIELKRLIKKTLLEGELY